MVGIFEDPSNSSSLIIIVAGMDLHIRGEFFNARPVY